LADCTRIMLAITLLGGLLAAFTPCATVPRDPEDPSLEEQPLVDRAEAWRQDAGHPADAPHAVRFKRPAPIAGPMAESAVRQNVANATQPGEKYERVNNGSPCPLRYGC